MRTDKYDRLVWTILGLVVIGLCALSVGCRSQQEWQAAMWSTTIGGELGHGNEDRTGKRSWDSDYSALLVSVQPFAFQQMRMTAEMNARALTEQRYAERPPPPEPEPAPCGKPK